MDISIQMMEAVANAKRQAKSAEHQFDYAAEIVNIKSSSSIDLLSGRTTSQVADIASSVRKACDELYTSYQSLVLMLDQQCRPLLSQNHSTRAVKEVMEMIKWLNSESEIGSNFSGSLNGSSLGDFVSVRHFASMECQMIQKYWENIYSMMPGTEEEDRAFGQRQSEERIAAREAEIQDRIKEREWEHQERERERQKREDYHHAVNKWKQESDVVRAERNAEVEKRIRQIQHSIESDAKKSYEKESYLHHQTIKQQEERKAAAEVALAALGFFKFAEKKNHKSIINEATSMIVKAKRSLMDAESQYDSDIAAAAQTARKKKNAIETEVAEIITMPDKPKILQQKIPSDKNQVYYDAILNYMIPGKMYAVTDFLMSVPEFKGMTNQQVSAYLRRSIQLGIISRVEDNRKVYFVL